MSKQLEQVPQNGWSKGLDIPASGIMFASSGSLIGTAIAGPAGGVIGALVGAVGGVITEVASQKAHERRADRELAGG